jgi:putrescine transport system substrate-binding protein
VQLVFGCPPNVNKRPLSKMRHLAQVLAFVMLASSVGCDRHEDLTKARQASPDDNVVNLFIWSDFLAPEVLKKFEASSGVNVRVTYYESDDIFEARMMAGHTGFDVAVVPANRIHRQSSSGTYLALEKNKLPNRQGLDPEILKLVGRTDPENRYAVPYTWGTLGITYNEDQVAKALSGVPPNSWRLVFDLSIAKRLAQCGIGTLDAPDEVIPLALLYLGKSPYSTDVQDLHEAEQLLMSVRPYFRSIDTSNLIESLANGDLCIAIDSNGDGVQERNRAAESQNGNRIRFSLPEEGSLLWADLLAIPSDAPHVDNAYKLINFLLDPHVMAGLTNSTGFANASAAATPLVKSSIASDPAVYISSSDRNRLYIQEEDSLERSRTITRIWQRFKTGT